MLSKEDSDKIQVEMIILYKEAFDWISDKYELHGDDLVSFNSLFVINLCAAHIGALADTYNKSYEDIKNDFIKGIDIVIKECKDMEKENLQ